MALPLSLPLDAAPDDDDNADADADADVASDAADEEEDDDEASYHLSRLCATRSQKWYVPSEPAVAKTVAWRGWKATALTAHTFCVWPTSALRWQRNWKLILLRGGVSGNAHADVRGSNA